MAKPIFDTTQTSPNNPGLSYVTPQGLPAKYNSLGGAIQMTDELLKDGIELDKQLTVKQADLLAKQLANEYETSSITGTQNLLTDKENLEDQLSSDPKNAEIQAKLDVVTQRYELAKEQGIISPYEFERRVLKDSQDLATANPAYEDEIAARVNKTLNNVGTLDLIKRDAALMKAQQDSQIKEFDEIKKYLGKRHVVTVGKSNEDIIMEYQIEQNEERKRLNVTEIIGDYKLDNDVKQLAAQKYINESGGPQKAAHNLSKGLLLDLENISNRFKNNEINLNEATRARDELGIQYQQGLNNFATAMGKDEGFTAIYQNLKGSFEEIMKSSESRMFGTDATLYFENEFKTSETMAMLNFKKSTGKSPALMKLEADLLKAMESLIANTNSGLSVERRDTLVSEILMISANPGASGLNLKSFEENPMLMVNKASQFNDVLDGQIVNGDDISTRPEAFAFLNNIFSTVKNQKNPNEKYTVAKKLLSTINGEDYDKTLPYMMGSTMNTESSGSEWQEDVGDTINYFELATRDNIRALNHTKDMYFIRNNRIYSKVGTNQAREMAESMNIAMELRAKIAGVDSLKEEDVQRYLDSRMTGIN